MLQALLEAQQKLSLTSSTLDATRKRNMELQARCDELGKRLEAERKLRYFIFHFCRYFKLKLFCFFENLRMEIQRDHKSKKKEKSTDEQAPSASSSSQNSNNSSAAMPSEDVEMLEITLGMLRCSVCRDRFKEVAITRCFHLFCRHCIDENIRNRHRKCPACGEKFGQDDVKTIYFTH